MTQEKYGMLRQTYMENFCVAPERYQVQSFKLQDSPDSNWTGSKMKSECLLGSITSWSGKRVQHLREIWQISDKGQTQKKWWCETCRKQREKPFNYNPSVWCLLTFKDPPEPPKLQFTGVLEITHFTEEENRPRAQKPQYKKGNMRNSSSRRFRFQAGGSLLQQCVLWWGRVQLTSSAALSWISHSFGLHWYMTEAAAREEKRVWYKKDNCRK